jgi:hypothetical protein
MRISNTAPPDTAGLRLPEAPRSIAKGSSMAQLLDPEALENALQMLIELQQGGRLVGIISHVGDLRQHIDARLTLTKTANGSTATFHV